jgi:hypothetical protein
MTHLLKTEAHAEEQVDGREMPAADGGPEPHVEVTVLTSCVTSK